MTNRNAAKKLLVLPLMLGIAGAFSALQCNNAPPSGGAAGTGTLKLLITDKPFPFDLIDEALVTITRVEIHRDGVEACESECDDGAYCNGEESCDDGECAAGTAPCGDGFDCDEEADQCRKVCADDAGCDDAAFCNGAETCVDGYCAAGAFACESGSFCDEEGNACSTVCLNDAHCDDGAFCNGAETCVEGACASGSAPCSDEQTCHEEDNGCHDEEDGDDDGDDDDDNNGPWVVIFEGEKVFNLLDLRNGRTDLLADAEVPAGDYSQMRLVVTEGELTLNDGRTFLLTVPSGAQSGIKLHFDFTVEDGEETQLLLDVDLSRAFTPIPGGQIEDPSTIRNFHFSPSLAMRLINILEAGSIAGTVTTLVEDVATPLENVVVTAYVDDEEVTSTASAADGTYLLGGLTTGTYRVEFSLVGYDDAVVSDVSVAAEQTTSGVDAVLTATAP